MDESRKTDIINDIFQVFRKYKDVSHAEFGKLLNQLAQNYDNDEELAEEFAKEEYKYISEDDKQALDDYWKSVMQGFINLMNERPEIMRELKEAKVKVKESWDERFRNLMDPDIRFTINADNLDWSIERKEWTPVTDSTFTIQVGNQYVISLF